MSRCIAHCTQVFCQGAWLTLQVLCLCQKLCPLSFTFLLFHLLVLQRADVVMTAFGRNYAESQVDECIQEYESLGVWQYDAAEGLLRVVSLDD